MTLYRALFGEKQPRCIAFVGAGGKTSSVLQMAKELRQAGRRVIITTSTKMHPPEDVTLLTDSAGAAERLLDERGLAWVGTYYNVYKIEGIPALLPELLRMADHVLIETDGAKTMPLKMADFRKEPVIYDECDAMAVVCGMTAVGRRAEEVLFRRELTELAPEHIITPADAAMLLRRCYEPRYAILNQCDDGEKIAAAKQIAALLPDCRCVLTRRAKPIE